MALGQNNQPRPEKRQPVIRLSQLSAPQSAKSRPPKKRRVKHFRLPIIFSGRRLVISFRRFRTSKAKRSKAHRQFIFSVYLLPVKEIAIKVARLPRKKVPKRWSAPWLWLRLKTAIPVLLIIVGVSGGIYFSLDISRPIKLEPITTNPVPAPMVIKPVEKELTKTLPRSEPTRVRIARLEIDASLSPVGRQADGTMEVPNRYDIAGWYNLAPTPGELGPAIIVGHVDRPGGVAIFWRLREMQPGDIFEVDRADGKIVKFKVDVVKQFPQDNFPTAEVYGDIDHAGIRLITCGGVFNAQAHRYSHNTVVYGSLVI